MSVTVYKALKHRILAGKKIYQNNSWKTIPGNAKIWLNGTWHKIGSGAAENAVSIPEDPEQSVTHENGTEPSSGTIWYITPEGAGNMDGSSWANAASGSMIHAILLSVSNGDSVYFSEGDYTTDRTIVLPAGVNLYGGFDADTPAWSTRNGFTKQTVFTGNNAFCWMDGYAATAGQVVDGFVIKNYYGTITGSNATLRNSIVNLGTASLPKASHCVFISANANVSQADYCNFFYGNTAISVSADHVCVYGRTNLSKVTTSIELAQYCTAVNCSATGDLFGDNATDCTAVNCSADGDLFGDVATNCTATYCSAPGGGTKGYIFPDGANNCIAISSTARNGIFDSGSQYCTAINCSDTPYIF